MDTVIHLFIGTTAASFILSGIGYLAGAGDMEGILGPRMRSVSGKIFKTGGIAFAISLFLLFSSVYAQAALSTV